MTTKSFMWGMRFITILAVVACVLLIIFVSPYRSQDPSQKLIVNIVLFNITLFFALTGIFTLFLFSLRKKVTGNEIVAAHLGISFRQGMLLALTLIALLLLQSFRILTWWDGLLAMGAIMMVELYFLAK